VAVVVVVVVVVAVVMEEESPYQTEDQNGSNPGVRQDSRGLLNQIHEPLVLVVDRV
jgi:hypothetical protein